GVARGVHGLDGDVAQRDLVTVMQALGLEAVLPVVAALAGDVRGRPGCLRELAGAGQVVGVDVGLDDGGDRHAVAGGKVQIFADIPAGVHHHRLVLGLATDEVAGLGEVFVINPFEKHRGLLGDRGALRWACPERTYLWGYLQYARGGMRGSPPEALAEGGLHTPTGIVGGDLSPLPGARHATRHRRTDTRDQPPQAGPGTTRRGGAHDRGGPRL